MGKKRNLLLFPLLWFFDENGKMNGVWPQGENNSTNILQVTVNFSY